MSPAKMLGTSGSVFLFTVLSWLPRTGGMQNDHTMDQERRAEAAVEKAYRMLGAVVGSCSSSYSRS
jgi:hypothetical protein